MSILNKSQIRDVKIGEGTRITEPVNLYECTIGNNSFVGPFVEIQNSITFIYL